MFYFENIAESDKKPFLNNASIDAIRKYEHREGLSDQLIPVDEMPERQFFSVSFIVTDKNGIIENITSTSNVKTSYSRTY